MSTICIHNSETYLKLRAHLQIGTAAGDRLPGEPSPAARLDISRTALRVALEQLKAEGSVERRPQSGTFLAVVPPPSAHGGRVVLLAPFQETGERESARDREWLHRVASAFERTARPAGAELLLLDQSPRADDACSVVDRTSDAARAQAVVLLHPLGTRGKIACVLAVLHDLGVHPLVVSARNYAGLAGQVYFDSEWGAYLAARRLLTWQHRRIGFAGGSRGHDWVQERLRGCQTALEASDLPLPPRWIFAPNDGEHAPTLEDGRAAFPAWHALSPALRPTGIVAANDVVALGLLGAVRAHGVSIPDDLSLIGFDNDLPSLPAGLTTVERPTEALGEAVARTVLERLALGPQAGTVTLRLRPVLIERATAGPPPLLHKE